MEGAGALTPRHSTSRPTPPRTAARDGGRARPQRGLCSSPRSARCPCTSASRAPPPGARARVSAPSESFAHAKGVKTCRARFPWRCRRPPETPNPNPKPSTPNLVRRREQRAVERRADLLWCLAFRGQGLGFGVQGLGVGVTCSGFRVQGSGFRVQGSGFGVWGLGCRVQGLGVVGPTVPLKSSGKFPNASRHTTCGSEEGSYLSLIDLCIPHF